MDEQNNTKPCKVCGQSKVLSDFPIVSARAEAIVRRGPCCKPCKAQRERQRRGNGGTGKTMLEQASPQSSITSHDLTAIVQKVLQHPSYEKWEVQKTIKFFERLAKWRDKARANGQIDW